MIKIKQIKEAFNQFEELISEEKIIIEKKVEERMALHVEDTLLTMYQAIHQCESPIEKIFAIELDREVAKSKLNHYGDVFDWTPQCEIKVNEGLNSETKYRVDFMVEFVRFNRDGGEGNIYKFVIECDGHDFHEKTKEQATRDKKRDRDLMENGITVIRFTGSEIYDNPYRCARSAVKIIEKYIISLYRT